MTHEVRAPLRAITSFTQLLQEEEAWRMGEQGRQDLCLIQAAAVQMRNIIDGLLAFARVERSNHQIQPVSLEPCRPYLSAAVAAGDKRTSGPDRHR